LSYTAQAEDAVVLFTDGITEARHEGNVLLGKDGTMEYLENPLHFTSDEIAGGLLELAKIHANGSLQDDAAIVVMHQQN
jgi:serine phosphatase RsbU (regulator of sigma subunit)